ncbi:MAG: NnrS family protein, partial [Ktedonobacteraceae bacterium]|nr:NnrS family protein [Ktedonobacteraceae bacterium]
TGNAWLAVDAARHSFALGFLTLLICGLSPRMLPGFSGRHIVSPKLVSATFWLGNTAALLRVGASLLAPLLTQPLGSQLLAWLLALSGMCGLFLIGCLTVNLWPTLCSSPSSLLE